MLSAVHRSLALQRGVKNEAGIGVPEKICNKEGETSLQFGTPASYSCPFCLCEPRFSPFAQVSSNGVVARVFLAGKTIHFSLNVNLGTSGCDLF